jgi:hypothetical protein
MDQRVNPIGNRENALFNTIFIILNFVLIFKMTIANITCLSKNVVKMVEKFRNYSGYFGNIKFPYSILDSAFAPAVSCFVDHRLT